MTYALRQLLKSPGFTIVALLTLAIGIGVNTGMFAALDALVLQKSPAPDSDQLVAVSRSTGQSNTGLHAPANFADFRRQSTAFASLAAYAFNSTNLAEPDQPAEHLSTLGVTAEFFVVFGIAPELGRAFTAAEDRAGASPVAVISDGFWRQHFAADPGVIGRSVRMDGRPVTIVGVMPRIFDNPTTWGRIDVWQPLAYDVATWKVRDKAWLYAIGRLKPGGALGQARAEADAIGARLAHDYPQANARAGFYLDRWNSARVSPLNRQINWLAMGLAGFVLLIACANLANLQLARVGERVREHAVRLALGATRWQLIRQLLVECLILSVAGGGLGLLMAGWCVDYTRRELVINGDPGMVDISISWSVLAFALLASVATGVLFGTLPALIAARTNVSSALKQGARGSTGGRTRHRLRQVLIAAELALALILLAGAGFIVRGLHRFAQSDYGWRPDGIIAANLVLPFNANYASDDACRSFVKKLETGLAQLPGCQGVSIAAFTPILGFWQTNKIAVDGRPAPLGQEPQAYFDDVSPGYFTTLGMHLVAGRGFTEADRADSAPVVVVNETLARALWPGQDPVGQRLGNADPANRQWARVIGVVNDVHPSVELVVPAATPFQAYRPLAQASNAVRWLNLDVHSTAPAEVVSAAIRQTVARIDPDESVYSLLPARELIRQQITTGFVLLAKVFSALALGGLALAAVGIYGVIANLVVQRTTEFGIRMALGAQARDVLVLVLRQGAQLALLGAAVGLLGALGLIRVFAAILPNMPGTDWVLTGATLVLLVGVALLACWLPARRATRVDPIIALRAE